MKNITLVAASAMLVFGATDLAACDSGSTVPFAASGGTTAMGGAAGVGGAGTRGGDTSVAGTSSLPADALPMDSAGWVDKASNSFNIQGSWYWYADFSDSGAGLTKLPTATDKTPPFVEGKGMCITGTTPGGAADNYVTWGAGIGLNLNQGTEEAGGTTPQVLKPYPKCFAVTLSGDSKSPGGMLGKLLEANPMPGTTANPTVPQEAPSIVLKAGQTTDVCIDNVVQPSWCTASGHSPGDCADPKNLANGIAGIQVQALAGSSGGDIQVCVVSIVPKN